MPLARLKHLFTFMISSISGTSPFMWPFSATSSDIVAGGYHKKHWFRSALSRATEFSFDRFCLDTGSIGHCRCLCQTDNFDVDANRLLQNTTEALQSLSKSEVGFDV